jgi:hypothetical protein
LDAPDEDGDDDVADVGWEVEAVSAVEVGDEEICGGIVGVMEGVCAGVG